MRKNVYRSWGRRKRASNMRQHLRELWTDEHGGVIRDWAIMIALFVVAGAAWLNQIGGEPGLRIVLDGLRTRAGYVSNCAP